MTERPPQGLREPGQALWRDVLADVGEGWQLDARERHLLERAARCADELEDLERAVDAHGVVVAGSRGQRTVHPALTEARQLRLTQLRLLGAIELPDDEEQPRTQASLRAERAARSRWDRRQRLVPREELRRGA